MNKRDLICTGCPKGCRVSVEYDDSGIISVTGNTCVVGAEYAKNEILHPMRMVTSTVRIEGADIERLPVKTSENIPREKIMDIMDEINRVSLKAPVDIGSVVIKDVCGTGADIIATRSLKEKMV